MRRRLLHTLLLRCFSRSRSRSSIVQGWRATADRPAFGTLLRWGGEPRSFFALSPFLLVEPLTAWRDITANRQIVIDRAVTAGAFAPPIRYGSRCCGRRRSANRSALWDSSGHVDARHLPPAVRALLLWHSRFRFCCSSRTRRPPAAISTPSCLSSRSSRRGRSRTDDSGRGAGSAASGFAVALAAAPGALASVESDRFLRQDDTRTLAQRFIEAHVPQGSTILTQPYSSALTPSRDGLTEALTRNLGSAEAASTKFRLQLSLDPYPSPAYRLIYLGRGGLDAERSMWIRRELGGSAGLEPLRRLGVTYVLVKRYNRPDPETLPLLDGALTRGTADRRVLAVSAWNQRARTGADRSIPAQHRCPDRRRARASWSTTGDLATECPWDVRPPKRSPNFASRSRRARAPSRWRGTPGHVTGAGATSTGSSGFCATRTAGPIDCRLARSTKPRCGAICTASSATSSTSSTSRVSGVRR